MRTLFIGILLGIISSLSAQVNDASSQPFRIYDSYLKSVTPGTPTGTSTHSVTYYMLITDSMYLSYKSGKGAVLLLPGDTLVTSRSSKESFENYYDKNTPFTIKDVESFEASSPQYMQYNYHLDLSPYNGFFGDPPPFANYIHKGKSFEFDFPPAIRQDIIAYP